MLKYSAEYWDNYYSGPYEDTFGKAFNPIFLLSFFKKKPKSFADIGCGPGQTLVAMEKATPLKEIYGVECQQIPKERLVHNNIIFGDFLQLYKKLPAVEFLYISCSMYIPWEFQTEFLNACLSLSTYGIYFANVYLEDEFSIPEDSLRKVIYRDRESFHNYIEKGGFKAVDSHYDFFIRDNL